MQEIFYEETALTVNAKSSKTKYTVFNIIFVIACISAGIWFLWTIFDVFFTENANIVFSLLFSLLPTTIFVAIAVFAAKLRDGSYCDYDYTYVTGSIRISKVINNKKRSFVIKFDVRDVEMMGRYDSPTYQKYSNITKPTILTSNEQPDQGKAFFYIVVNCPEKKLLVLECTETFIANILKETGVRTLEKESLK